MRPAPGAQGQPHPCNYADRIWLFCTPASDYYCRCSIDWMTSCPHALPKKNLTPHTPLVLVERLHFQDLGWGPLFPDQGEAEVSYLLEVLRLEQHPFELAGVDEAVAHGFT